MVKIALALITLLYMQCASALTQVTASIDKNPVMMNESLILTVVANDNVEANALDTSSLQKGFIVGRTSVSTQTNIINGQSNRTTSWTTLLMPRKTGKFVIPALTLKQLRTQPINIDVIDQPLTDGKKSQKIFITSAVSNSEVYVQEPITLSVKLHFSVELKRGALSDPTLDGANISQRGKDKETTEIIKGIRYRTIERTYAITPQKSGEFTIVSPLFEGEIVGENQRRSSFFNFNDSKPVQVRGNNLPITVKAIPLDVQGNWLPSELVTLHQEWQPDISTFKVGEPITRVLTLTAAGLSEEQLPKLSMSVPKGLKVYPDQPQLHSRVSNNHLVSQKVQNFALVASQPGDYQLPEVKITWWNTITNKIQYAVIPAQKILIAKSDEWDKKSPVNSNIAPNSSTESSISTLTSSPTPWLQWLFMGLWLVTCLAWYISARSKTKTLKGMVITNDPTSEKLTLNAKNIERNLLKACKAHQGETVLALLVPWINQQYSPLNAITLEDAITTVNDSNFTNALINLQACYFGKSPQTWRGNDLLNILKRLTQISNKKTAESFTLNP